MSKYYESTTNLETSSAVSAMQRISAGIEECDANKYQMGLEELRKTLPAAKTADDTFAIFSDYVEADYGDMMKDDFNNILIVRRCLEKHLYQQALTFLESFMPSQYLKSSVLSVRITNPKLLEEGKKKAGKAKKE